MFCASFYVRAVQHLEHDVPSTDTLTDAELVAAVHAGENGAFGVLYERYRHRIHAFCRRMVRDNALAEDIAQDTFVKARMSLASLHAAASVRTWLFRIARNEALMKLRASSPLPSADDEPLDTSTPLDVLITMERQDAVRRLLDMLRPQYREVLVLREYEEMSYEEIAAVTATSVPSVKSRIFKARKALAAQLKALYAERRRV